MSRRTKRNRRRRSLRATAALAAVALVAPVGFVAATAGSAGAQTTTTVTISGDAAARNPASTPAGGWTYGGGYFDDFTDAATGGTFSGVTFETGPAVEEVTPAALAGVEVYIASAVQDGYSDSEEAALLEFVAGGGVLIALSNNATHQVTDFLGEPGTPVLLGDDVFPGDPEEDGTRTLDNSVLPDRPATLNLRPAYTNFIDTTLPDEAVRLYSITDGPVAALIPPGTAQFGAGAVFMGTDADIFAGCETCVNGGGDTIRLDNPELATQLLELIAAHFAAPPPGGGGDGGGGGGGDGGGLPPGFCRASTNPPSVPNPASAAGYWFLGRDGGVFAFGDVQFLDSLPGRGINAQAVGMSARRDGQGYWVVDTAGNIYAFGAAQNLGDMRGTPLNAPIIGLEPTPSGNGYWLLASDGGVFSFGDAVFHGSTGAMRLNAPIVAMRATPSGNGYWLLGRDGGVFSFGDASFHGSTGGMTLNAPVISMAVKHDGNGYWLLGEDGGVFSFGSATFKGSVPGIGLCANPTTVQIRSTATGEGYYLLGTDGGVFSFGDAEFKGSLPGLGITPNAPLIDMVVQAPSA